MKLISVCFPLYAVSAALKPNYWYSIVSCGYSLFLMCTHNLFFVGDGTKISFNYEISYVMRKPMHMPKERHISAVR